MRRMVLVALAALLGLVALETAGAQGPTATVEVRVWQNVRSDEHIRISARPAGGSWRTLGTILLPLDQTNPRGTFRYGDIELDVPLPRQATPATVEVRVWQAIRATERVYISARPAGGDWSVLGTIRLLLDDGFSRSGAFRFGDISLDVPLPARFDTAVPTVTIEFDGEFPEPERAELEAELGGEFTRAATFYARYYGVAAPGLRIVMERPAVGAGYGDGTIWLSDRFESAIAHEYVHAVQDQLSPGLWGPGWMIEGVATYFELLYEDAVGDRAYEEARNSYLRGARFADGPFRNLEAGVAEAEQYGLSLLAVERLAERAGDDALFDFYRRLRVDSPWQSTFADVFGVTDDAFYESFEAYRFEVAPRLFYFRGTVFGPGGAPVEGLTLLAKREGEDFSWEARTRADGAFDLPAESFLNSGFLTVLDDDGNPVAGDDAAPVVLEMRTNNCDVFGYVGPDGGMVKYLEEAREFLFEGRHVTGIVINLPIDPWSIPIVTGCGTYGIDLDGDGEYD